VKAQPKTAVNALLALPLPIGKAKLLPPSLGVMLLLECLDSPFVREEAETATSLDTFVAAYILASGFEKASAVHIEGKLRDEAVKWCGENWQKDYDLKDVIQALLIAAFAPLAKTHSALEKGISEVNVYGNGLGYLLTTLDALCADYGWTIEYALSIPMATAFAMLVARKINSGEEWSEPNYFERDMDFGAVEKYITAMGFGKKVGHS